MEVPDHIKMLLCAGVTLLQKALVFHLVKENHRSFNLSIGDGKNHVSMIQQEHMGVEIFGKEGTEASILPTMLSES